MTQTAKVITKRMAQKQGGFLALEKPAIEPVPKPAKKRIRTVVEPADRDVRRRKKNGRRKPKS